MEEKILVGLVEAGKELAPKVYDDALQPVMKETGKALGTVGKAINAALAPLRWMVYGFEEIDARVQSGLQQKLNHVKPEKISLPEAHIAVPAYEALRYSIDNDELRQMYINLIASSMVEDSREHAHPAFVEVIKQLSPFEAKLIKNLTATSETAFGIAKTRIEKSEHDSEGFEWIVHIIDPRFGMNLENNKKYSVALENLHRLKIIDIHYETSLIDDSEYLGIESGDIVNHCKQFSNSVREGYQFLRCKRGILRISQFGKSFVDSCVK